MKNRKMKNSSPNSTLTYKTRKTSGTHLRWFQTCLTGAVVTVRFHRPEHVGFIMAAMSLIWSILSRTMTQQSQKERKKGMLAWVWKCVACQNPHTGLDWRTGSTEVGSDPSNQKSFMSLAILPMKDGWQPLHKIQFIPNHSGLIMLMQTEWWLGWGRGIIPKEEPSRLP